MNAPPTVDHLGRQHKQQLIAQQLLHAQQLLELQQRIGDYEDAPEPCPHCTARQQQLEVWGEPETAMGH